MTTGFVLKLNVGGFTAPVGLEVTVAASITLPLKPALGVTTMEDVFPVVAPLLTVKDVLPMEKL
jgi:hypothetical protein